MQIKWIEDDTPQAYQTAFNTPYMYVIVLACVWKNVYFIGGAWAKSLVRNQESKFQLKWCLQFEAWSSEWNGWLLNWTILKEALYKEK